MDKHDLVARLKELASELGRAPTRDEFRNIVREGDLQKTFGTYTNALLAAGFKGRDLAKKHNADKKNPLLRSIFDIKPSPLNSKFPLLGPYPKIVCIGDLHAPWACEDSLQIIYQLISEVKPDYVVQLGDSYDFFSASKFPKQILFTPKEEVDSAQKQLTKIFNNIHEAHPSAKKYAILGNHDIRPIKRLIEEAPDLEPFFELDKYFKFPHCETIMSTREILEIGGIAFTHGFMGHGAHMRKLEKPVVHGHLHRGQLTLTKINGRWLWELDAGYVGNPGSVCFNYTTLKESRWTRGVGLITEFGPHFIPFE